MKLFVNLTEKIVKTTQISSGGAEKMNQFTRVIIIIIMIKNKLSNGFTISKVDISMKNRYF